MTEKPPTQKRADSATAPCDHPLDPLVEVMALLRSDDGCPWDREQDPRSLKKYLIEEAYEVLDAIDEGENDALVEELGDVLLQVVFHAQIASERGDFTIDDIVDAVTEKLIRRHPHVFGDEEAPDADAVLRNWDRLKQEERADRRSQPVSLFDGIPRELPALMYAYEAQKRAAKVGFEWEDASGALDKVAEETKEIAAASRAGDEAHLREEWGDLLFAVVNAARYAGVEPEEALRGATRKFESRFRFIEQRATTLGKDLRHMNLAEMDAHWDEAKRKERPV